VVVGEGDVAGFLRQVDVGDLVQQRGHLKRTTVLHRLLVMQRLFAAKHRDHMENTGVSADESHDLAR
jgi:hypothetical protein